MKAIKGFLATAVGAAFLASAAGAQTAAPWPPEGSADAPAGSIAIPVFGKKNPGKLSDELESRFMGGEPVLRNITYPTLTPVLPAPGKGNGTAVIVAPGGGFAMLSMKNEGWRVAQALADRGIAAFVLKYRLNPTPRDDAAFNADMVRTMRQAMGAPGRSLTISDPAATLDALAALQLVRDRAAEWHVDPARVGMIGFSAGAMTTMNAVLEAGTDGDAATRGPDFIGYIYGPMDKVVVPADAPPMFAALSFDDPLFGRSDMSLATAWRDAKKPVELHVYQAGGHGFGLGRPGTTTTLLMNEFLAWMDMHGLLQAKAKKP